METKIISVVGEKGGIGKTTLNIILASDLFYAKGKKVVLLDLDNPQYSIYNKRQRELESLDEEERQSIELYPIEPVTVATLQDTIVKHYGMVDYIILDLPGSLNVEMVKGLLYVEHVFVPFDHDELEIDSTSHFYFTLKNNFLDNEERMLKSIHLFFNKYKLVKKNKFAVLRQQFLEADIPMMESVVKDKTIYKERYRNTLYPIPQHKELGEKDIKHFFKEVAQLTR
ncbi:ParA family protein [Muricauda sp. 334s03]|uniref:ParA family protein n=1 Tax=Flagellimonas yonaguniensis TaxID=3031325 RepID=A0ABT5XZN2_9FLAO|nr:ParA family protein [[Muricauda] yonaguniensis]MDF0716564.1 ParA family protein [[Muricauda] yonaguniensis]